MMWRAIVPIALAVSVMGGGCAFAPKESAAPEPQVVLPSGPPPAPPEKPAAEPVIPPEAKNVPLPTSR